MPTKKSGASKAKAGDKAEPQAKAKSGARAESKAKPKAGAKASGAGSASTRPKKAAASSPSTREPKVKSAKASPESKAKRPRSASASASGGKARASAKRPRRREPSVGEQVIQVVTEAAAGALVGAVTAAAERVQDEPTAVTAQPPAEALTSPGRLPETGGPAASEPKEALGELAVGAAQGALLGAAKAIMPKKKSGGSKSSEGTKSRSKRASGGK